MIVALGAPASPFFATSRAALPDPADERDWATRGARGDREALRRIVVAHQDPVFRLLMKLTGERELALDLSQETFVKAFAALEGFRGGGAMRPWLFRIANNLFLDHVRRRKPESLDLAREEGDWREPAAEDATIATLADGLAVEAALADLPPTWRQAVVLRHVEDLTYEAIAEILGVPLGTAKTWLHRGRERLRTLLADAPAGAGGTHHDL